MNFHVREIGGGLVELEIRSDQANIFSGTLDQKEAEEIAIDMVNAAENLMLNKIRFESRITWRMAEGEL